MGDWINQNLQILATLGSALGVYFLIRFAARKDVLSVKEEIKTIKDDMKEIRIILRSYEGSLKSIDSRLSHLEGAFEERGRQEPKIFLIKGDQVVEK